MNNPQITIKPRQVSVTIEQPLQKVIEVCKQGPAGAGGSNATQTLLHAMSDPQITIKPKRVSVTIEQPLQKVIVSNSVALWANFKLQALQGYLAPYQVLTFSGADVSQIKTYDTAAMDILLLTQAFTYADGDLTQQVLTNARTGVGLTKTYSYSGSDLSAIEAVLT